VEARKPKNKQTGPEEGKAGRHNEFSLSPTCDAIGRESICIVAATLQEIGKHAIGSPAKADENMLLPLAQNLDKRSLKQAELVEILSNTYGFATVRKQSNTNWLVRMMYYNVRLQLLRQAFPEPA